MLFELNSRNKNKIKNSELLGKIKTKKSSSNKKSNSIISQIEQIRKTVMENLGYFDARIINTREELTKYLKQVSEYGYCAIDTETTGLDPIRDRLAGICMYSPNTYAAYIPVNHVDYVTGERYKNQLTTEEVKELFDEFYTAKTIFHYATFDIRVLRNQSNIYLKAYWDTSIAGKILNENEPSHGLKQLFEKYVSHTRLEKRGFKELFESKIKFIYIPIDIAAKYAAKDAYMTFELYEFQYKYINPEVKRKDLRDAYYLYSDIEIPVIDSVCNMEDEGVPLDFNVCENLSIKYNRMLEEAKKECLLEVEKYRDEIEAYKESLKLEGKGKKSCIENPMNIASTQQVAEFIYDVLKTPPIDKKQPKGTGEEIISKIKIPFVEALLKFRSAQKLVSTYVDKMPKIAHKDGRIRGKFNQYGAVTGRFSSSDPNMQNIPSHTKDIRLMFCGGTENYELEDVDGMFEFEKSFEVEVNSNWKFVELLNVGDVLDCGLVTKVEVEPGLLGKVRVWVEER